MDNNEFLSNLSKYDLLKEYLKSKVLENKLKNIVLTEEEILIAKESYMKYFSLKDSFAL